jgi:HD-GYP domain-containing protein (c-di-GMP phosphodiesterase class II)
MNYVGTSQPALYVSSHGSHTQPDSWQPLVGHTVRLARLVGSIGLMLDMDEDQLETLREAAHLHDIGKLLLPEAVLLKPAALERHEWDVIKTHTHWSRVLVGGIPDLTPDTKAAVLYHHERWDGGGYPHGLRGEAIPLAARILTVCDVYDTLLSKRAYSRAWSPSSALHELQANRGSQFDPLVVDAFLDRALGKMTSGG